MLGKSSRLRMEGYRRFLTGSKVGTGQKTAVRHIGAASRRAQPAKLHVLHTTLNQSFHWKPAK
jgi:polynucleotide 5'-kinase involved in rRNA processing